MSHQAQLIRYDAYECIRDGQYGSALTIFSYLAKNYGKPHDMVWLGLLYMIASNYRAAIDHYESAISQLPDDLSSHHHLAAIRSSCPEYTIRDGPTALMHAQRVNELRAAPTWRSLSILASSHAECGDFASAQTIARQALQLSPDGYRQRLITRLAGYQNREPYRMTQNDLVAAIELREHHCSICGKLDFVIWCSSDVGFTPRCIECARRIIETEECNGTT
jgi:tetratricopeptide (TPR) repeat protein